MNAGARGLALTILLTVLGLLAAGCTADAGSTAREVAVVTRNGCPTAYPHRLVLTAPASDATPSLRDLRGCTSDRGKGPVLLYDGGSAAWELVPGPYSSRVVGSSSWSHWLRARVAVPTGVLLPGESALVWAPPDGVVFRLDRDWTVAWTSLSAGVQALPTTGDDSQAAAAGPGSLRGRALVTCALTALHLLRTPSLRGTAPGPPPSAAASPYGATPSPPAAQQPVHGLTGLDALQATWAPSLTACAADWQRSDHRLESGSGSTVRWWTAWQRAKDWLTRVARGLQWLDHDGVVTLRVRS